MGLLDSLVQLLVGVPPWLATIILSALPVGELRGGLPVALTVYDFPIPLAVALSIIGNMLPVYFLLVFFERVSTWLMENSEMANRLLTKLFDRTRKKLEVSVTKHGAWALALFVAIPLPVTGAWTGTLAAFVFGLDKKKAFFAILVGLCISATIVTILTLGTSATLRFLL